MLLMILSLLSGCSGSIPSIHIEMLSDSCIKPMYDYHYQTCNPILFRINGDIFEIPANFKTDLASIPKYLWPIMAPAHSSLIRAAIIHDWLYSKTCFFSRYETDLIFYHVLKSDGISTIRASLMYYGVRIFGWNYYNDDDCRDDRNQMNTSPKSLELVSV